MTTDFTLVYVFVYVKSIPDARHFYEDTLGLKPIEVEEHAVKYDTGDVMLALNEAGPAGVSLPEKDNSSILVFHVDNVDEMRGKLAENGVAFAATERYDIGAIAPFHSPDGQSFMLYEPSHEALGWPSGDRIKKILARPKRHDVPLLGERKLLYTFLFVPDFKRAYDFYHDALGLRDLEQDDGEGVVKYDVGGAILATHRTKNVTPGRNLALVFHTSDIERAAATLKERGVDLDGIRRSEIGAVARFDDPFGHMLYLYSPSEQAKSWPSGKLIGEALRAWR
jgi:predicted enzyme related to lactoylglutathione lyase